jgi:hypothetical protein
VSFEVDVLEEVEGGGARRGGRGRKLQEPGGRLDTRVKISEMRRCWTDVSYQVSISVYRSERRKGERYQLRVELR